MKKNTVSKLAAIALSASMVVGTVMPTFAASEDVIDSSKKGSITIHKYDMTAAKAAGVDLDKLGIGGYSNEDSPATDSTGTAGNSKSTGLKNTIAEEALKNYVIKGVEFSYLRVGNVETLSKNGDVKVIYGIDKDLQGILGLSADDAAKTDGDVYYYTSTQINTAMTTLLSLDTKPAADKDNTVGAVSTDGKQRENQDNGDTEYPTNTAGKNALENYMKDHKGTAMSLTDINGETSATDLDLGLYLIVETKVPEDVIYTTNPWFVQLPMTDDSGDHWVYDLDCYPKNQTGVPTLEKQVRNNTDGVASVSSADNNVVVKDADKDEHLKKTEYSYADTVTATEGEKLDYYWSSKLPAITSEASYITQYTFSDQMAKGITYGKNAVVAIFDKAADVPTKTDADGKTTFDVNINNIDKAGAVAVWKDSDGMFTQTYDDEKNTMVVKFTEKGLKEINPNYSEKFMMILYTATVDSNDEVVLGDKGNPNAVNLEWKRTSTDYYDVLKDEAIVYSYGLDMQKNFSDDASGTHVDSDAGDATNVRFVIQNKTDGYFLIAEEESAGHYHVTGRTLTEGKDVTGSGKAGEATQFKPAADGKLYIAGLEADTYILTETHTDTAYSLLKDTIEIVINPTTAKIVGTEANVTGIQSKSDKDSTNNVGKSASEKQLADDIAVTVTAATCTVDGSNPTLVADGMYAAKNVATTEFDKAIYKDAATQSENGIVKMTVLNSRGFHLPQTGGNGLFAITIAGILVAGVGFFALNKKKGEEQA